MKFKERTKLQNVINKSLIHSKSSIHVPVHGRTFMKHIYKERNNSPFTMLWWPLIPFLIHHDSAINKAILIA